MKNNKINDLQRLLYLTFMEIYVIIREKMKGGTDYDQNDIDINSNFCRRAYHRPSNNLLYTGGW